MRYLMKAYGNCRAKAYDRHINDRERKGTIRQSGSNGQNGYSKSLLINNGAKFPNERTQTS